MTVLVYTANYSARDAAWAPVEQHGADVEWRYYTDGMEQAPEPWETIRECANPERHPNMAAKWYKTHPLTDGGYEATVWIDASMEVTSPTFVRDAVNRLAVVSGPVCAHAHPRRTDVYQEARASLGPEGLGRYDELPIMAQMGAYRREGFPSGWGLWACGVLAYEMGDRAREFGDAWWDECVRWGHQDQLSFPVVAWRAGYRPGTFIVPLIERAAGGSLENRWLRIHEHLPGTG